tara:strand:+ start:4483 stop:4779 length:297 start_codon:yes stop_codon:yes gene_type:complete
MVDLIESQLAAINAANAAKAAQLDQMTARYRNNVRSESPVLERHRKAVQLYLQEAMDAYVADDRADLVKSLGAAMDASYKVAQSSRRIKAYVEEARRA